MIYAVYLLVGCAIVLGVCVASLPAALVAFAHHVASQTVRDFVWRSAT